MRNSLRSMAEVAAAVLLLAAGCSQAAPAPTSAPAAPKGAEPTKAAAPAAPTAVPTVVPAKKVDFPEKGKTISLIVGYPAGGGADIGARVLAPLLEKELGTPVQVVNKAGAGSQVGLTETAKSKPDGYTVGYANFATIITIYLDPERKAAFGRNDLLPVALHLTDPMAIAVKADSPIKDIAGLVEAAKGKPDSVKLGTSGVLSQEDLSFAQLMKMTGVKFNMIAFDGAAPATTALVGGHIDAVALGLSSMMATVKGGQSRVIGTIGEGGDKFIPGVKSLGEQGYKGFAGVGRGWLVPAGTPKEVITVLTGAMKKAMESPEHQSKIAELGQVTTYKDPQEFAKYWDDMEATVKPIMAGMAKN